MQGEGMGGDRTRNELLPGTLEMLVLKTLSFGPLHGYGIAQHIQRMSGDALRVEEGSSLYPALQRLALKGWVRSQWKLTPTKRRARYYTVTAAGRKQLGIEASAFERLVAAIGRVMQADAVG
jgi:transcriptional regulator